MAGDRGRWRTPQTEEFEPEGNREPLKYLSCGETE